MQLDYSSRNNDNQQMASASSDMALDDDGMIYAAATSGKIALPMSDDGDGDEDNDGDDNDNDNDEFNKEATEERFSEDDDMDQVEEGIPKQRPKRRLSSGKKKLVSLYKNKSRQSSVSKLAPLRTTTTTTTTISTKKMKK